MRAWTGAIRREQVLEVLQRQRREHRIAQIDKYWSTWTGRGCAVGCTLVEFDRKAATEGAHERYEDLFGIPALLARLEDTLFESLDAKAAGHWPERFIKAIAPGAELDGIVERWMVWLLTAGDSAAARRQVRGDALAVAELYRRQAGGEAVSYAEWETTQRSATHDKHSKHGALSATVCEHPSSQNDAVGAAPRVACKDATGRWPPPTAKSLERGDIHERMNETTERMADKLIALLEEASANADASPAAAR